MSQGVSIWTDGACSGNPGPGGWGAVLRYGGHEKELKGGEALTTNNRMELTAAIEALCSLKRSCEVVLHTDSQYLRGGVTGWINSWKSNGWRTAGQKTSQERGPLASPGRGCRAAHGRLALGQGPRG